MATTAYGTSTVPDRRAELYAPIHRSGMMTWHPRKEVTSLVGGYRISNGNLGCPWPVDTRAMELRDEKKKMSGKLSRYESKLAELEAEMERRKHRQRPMTTGAARLGGSQSLSGLDGAPGGAESSGRGGGGSGRDGGGGGEPFSSAYPRRRAPYPARPTYAFNPNSSLGKQPLSLLPTVPGPIFGSSDVRNDPQRYWPLTLNRCGSGDHHERVVRLGKDMPHSRWQTASAAKFSLGGPKPAFEKRLNETGHDFKFGVGSAQTKFRTDKFKWA